MRRQPKTIKSDKFIAKCLHCILFDTLTPLAGCHGAHILIDTDWHRQQIEWYATMLNLTLTMETL